MSPDSVGPPSRDDQPPTREEERAFSGNSSAVSFVDLTGERNSDEREGLFASSLTAGALPEPPPSDGLVDGILGPPVLGGEFFAWDIVVIWVKVELSSAQVNRQSNNYCPASAVVKRVRVRERGSAGARPRVLGESGGPGARGYVASRPGAAWQ